MKSISCHNRSGNTLAVVICIMVILIVIAGIAAEFTMNVNRNAQRNNTLESAIAVGDSCIEILFNSWRTTCRATPTVPLATSAFSAAPTPSPGQFPNLPSVANFVKRGVSYNPSTDDATDYDPTYTISNYKVVAVGPEWTALSGASASPTPAIGTSTTSATYNYIASADVTLPALGANKTVVAKIRRVFQKQQMSPWNFAIFYVDPLEIHPGPLFTVTGWVNTNSNLYTGHNTLTFADKVTFGGDWFYPTAQNPTYGFMPGDTYHTETPTAPNWPSNLPPTREQALQPFGIDSTLIFNTTDSNPNNDSYHELIDPPNTLFSDPLAGQRYWDQASVIIQVTDGIAGVPGFDGHPGDDSVKFYTVTNTLTGTLSVPITSGSLYNALAGAITTNQTIQDNREGATIRVATLDVSQVENASGTAYKSGLPAAPIIYMYDSSETSGARRGIRIKNGSKIPTGGLTVASNNPVYLQGDFNTGGTGSAVPSNNPSNFNSDGTYIDPSNPPAPQVSGYTRAPTSILADAVDILSNSWSDANSGTVPTASPTTINAAIIAGIVPTNTYGDGAYSGGAENLPRFLEDWTSKTLTYYGSMVELYQSKQSIGEWGKANVYVPPTRQWYFDNKFQTAQPPGSIAIYSYIKGRWYVL